jgi:ABC-type lipoprotein export system ATPase subunit
MDIKNITIQSGIGKNGEKELLDELSLNMGDVISIVGPTGSGKTALINDIELFANRNTPSKRRILINGTTPPADFTTDPSKNPIALITQHTNFLSDLPVHQFLTIHAKIRQSEKNRDIVNETLEFANQLTGEPINKDCAMTELSGGQTRSLLIADAVIIGNSPIILLDEIENAGIHRTKAIELLKQYQKIFIFVTHDPRIALLSDFRVCMKNGSMQKLIVTDHEEKQAAEEIKKLDDLMLDFRTTIRAGGHITRKGLEDRLKSLGYAV